MLICESFPSIAPLLPHILYVFLVCALNNWAWSGLPLRCLNFWLVVKSIHCWAVISYTVMFYILHLSLKVRLSGFSCLEKHLPFSSYEKTKTVYWALLKHSIISKALPHTLSCLILKTALWQRQEGHNVLSIYLPMHSINTYRALWMCQLLCYMLGLEK